jgi:hypothetical protein
MNGDQVKTRKWSRRTVYVAAIVAMVASTGGFALASVLSVAPVNQSASFYEGQGTGVNGYSAPTLSVSQVPGGVSVCSSGPVTDAASAHTVVVVVSAYTGANNCSTLNFAEEFSLTFSATIVTQSNNFTITTQVGAGAVQTNSITILLGTGASTAFTATVDLYVDYGALPVSVSVLDLVIH